MLKKTQRIALDKDFSQIYKQGKRVSTSNLNLIYMPTSQNNSRFGFVVSKKQAQRIIDRNRIKRRLRAQISSLVTDTVPGFDIVIGGKSSALGINSVELRREIVQLMSKAKLLRKQ